MPDPTGKGLYFVNGRRSGALAAYHVRTKQSVDFVSEDATQPILSPDAHYVAYLRLSENGSQQELWFSDIDGKQKLKVGSPGNLITLAWSQDSSQFAFADLSGGSAKVYAVNKDGGNLRQVPVSAVFVGQAAWSPDAKTLYLGGYEADPAKINLWRANLDRSTIDLLAHDCGYVQDISGDGKYLLSGGANQAEPGKGNILYRVSAATGECTLIATVPPIFESRISADGKAVLYAVASHGEMAIFRQPWDGRSQPQRVMKLPFSFQQGYAGNAYDFSKDLSTIVYARPNGHADLYYLSQR
jgi:Tol biopolymer transport system component